MDNRMNVMEFGDKKIIYDNNKGIVFKDNNGNELRFSPDEISQLLNNIISTKEGETKFIEFLSGIIMALIQNGQIKSIDDFDRYITNFDVDRNFIQKYKEKYQSQVEEAIKKNNPQQLKRYNDYILQVKKIMNETLEETERMECNFKVDKGILYHQIIIIDQYGVRHEAIKQSFDFDEVSLRNIVHMISTSYIDKANLSFSAYIENKNDFDYRGNYQALNTDRISLSMENFPLSYIEDLDAYAHEKNPSLEDNQHRDGERDFGKTRMRKQKNKHGFANTVDLLVAVSLALLILFILFKVNFA